MSKDEFIHMTIAFADHYAMKCAGAAPTEEVLQARREFIQHLRECAAEPVNGDTIQASAIAENQSMQIPYR